MKELENNHKVNFNIIPPPKNNKNLFEFLIDVHFGDTLKRAFWMTEEGIKNL